MPDGLLSPGFAFGPGWSGTDYYTLAHLSSREELIVAYSVRDSKSDLSSVLFLGT